MNLAEIAKKAKKFGGPYATKDLLVVYVHNNEVKLIKKYVACREQLHRNVMGNSNRTSPIRKKRRVYLVATTACPKLTENNYRLLQDFCKTLGYKAPTCAWGVGGTKAIFSVDIRIFQNLIASALLFLCFKHWSKGTDAKTYKDFVDVHWFQSVKARERLHLIMDNWKKLFPAHHWDMMYRNSNSNLVYQGIGEFQQGRFTTCPEYNGRVKELLATMQKSS